MHRHAHKIFFAALCLGCAGCGDDGSPSGSTTGELGTGSSDATSASDTTLSTSITMTDSSSTSSSTSTTSDDTTSTSTTTSTTGVDSTTGMCEPGTDGCACDDGMCDTDLVCVADMCEATQQCDADANEPNDDETDPINFGEINDNDDNGGSIEGVLDHADDEDWFTYVGDDDVLYVVDPTREIVADGELRVCKFAECLNGLDNTEVACPPGTNEDTSPAGRPGCCGDQGFEMGAFNCGGTSEDSALIYIRLDQAVQQCVTYTLNYHF